jgi:predicted DNA-binding transcriptional regulator AlpA
MMASVQESLQVPQNDPRTGSVAKDPQPLLLTARQAASMCGKSLRTWRTWDALGLVPRPVRIGRSTLWRADELRDWVAAGCPRRQEWEARTQIVSKASKR